MIGLMLRSSNGSSILSLFNLLCNVPRWAQPLNPVQTYLLAGSSAKAIDNRTMMIGHPAFSD